MASKSLPLPVEFKLDKRSLRRQLNRTFQLVNDKIYRTPNTSVTSVGGRATSRGRGGSGGRLLGGRRRKPQTALAGIVKGLGVATAGFGIAIGVATRAVMGLERVISPLVNSSLKTDRSLTVVSNQLGLSAKEHKELGVTVDKAANDTGVLHDQLVSASNVFVGLNADGKALQDSMRLIGMAVNAFGVEAEDAGRTLAILTKGGVKDVDQAFAQILAVSNNSSVSMDLMAGEFAKINALGKKYNMTVKESTSVVGALGTVYSSPAESVTALRSALIKLQQKKVLDRLGISAQDAEGRLKSGTELLQETIEKTGGAFDKTLKAGFGEEAANLLSSLADPGVLKTWQDLLKVQGTAKQLEEANNRSLATFSGQIDMAKVRLQSFVNDVFADPQVKASIQELFDTLGSDEVKSATADMFAAIKDNAPAVIELVIKLAELAPQIIKLITMTTKAIGVIAPYLKPLIGDIKDVVGQDRTVKERALGVGKLFGQSVATIGTGGIALPVIQYFRGEDVKRTAAQEQAQASEAQQYLSGLKNQGQSAPEPTQSAPTKQIVIFDEESIQRLGKVLKQDQVNDLPLFSTQTSK
jgi:TP901 family phage tail tape measure protein